jgi:glycosyltransferase involved in cell wall biosynthesis
MKISAIIAAYNAEQYVSRAVRSCLDQSIDRKDYEIIVVDDGSTDNTQRVLRSFEGLIRVITLERNMGLPHACNVGIQSALSRFVVRVDADDYVHEDFLKVLYLYLSMNSEMDAVACDYLLVDDSEHVLSRKSAAESPIACGTLFRKDHLVEIGLYDETFRLVEDEDLRIRYEQKYGIHYVPLPLYRYRMHQHNATKNGDLMDHYRQRLREKHGLPANEHGQA